MGKKTITISGDTASGFDNGANRSFRVIWWLAAGSNYTSNNASSGAWIARSSNINSIAYGHAVNVTSSTSNTFYLTGCQLEVGTASDFEFLPFDINQTRCQRYYYVHASAGQALGIFWNYQSGVNNTVMHFPIMMRTTPSVTAASGSNYYRVYRNGSIVDFTGFSGLQESSSHLAALDSSLSGTGGQAGRVKCNDNGLIVFSAEL